MNCCVAALVGTLFRTRNVVAVLVSTTAFEMLHELAVVKLPVTSPMYVTSVAAGFFVTVSRK